MSQAPLKLHELIRIIGKKSPLFSSSLNNLESYKLYFEGIFLALQLSHKINFEREISAWFQPHVNLKAANMVWFEQFTIYYANKSEKEKIEIFIETIALFFEENNDFNLPNWDF